MKDILDQEIKIGDLIAYTTIIGRSANLGLYEVRGFTDSGKMRCHPIAKSYGVGRNCEVNVPGLGKIPSNKVIYDPKLGNFRLKNKEDLQTESDKTTFLSMGERCIILNGDSADIIKEILYQQRLDIENAI
jgi:hypothetical protein